MNDGVTKKIQPLEVSRREGRSIELERPDFHARLVVHLKGARESAGEIPAGDSIATAIRNLLERAEAARLDALPDITHAVVAA